MRFITNISICLGITSLVCLVVALHVVSEQAKELETLLMLSIFVGWLSFKLMLCCFVIMFIIKIGRGITGADDYKSR